MTKIREYIRSGILEMYVLGITSPEEKKEVEILAATHVEIANEIREISQALEAIANKSEVTPDPTIKPFLMATIDYTERLMAGEPISFPPELNEDSKPEDFKEWLSRSDMKLPTNFEEFHAKIIGHTPQATTAIVWINSGAPPETHDNEYEKFLIVEGSCDIIIGNDTHALMAGDYLAIPLHKEHFVKVTSRVPCKIILQRIAA
jgi:mannose-6-phosphate isomerase-like protein (cupin superfamily)